MTSGSVWSLKWTNRKEYYILKHFNFIINLIFKFIKYIWHVIRGKSGSLIENWFHKVIPLEMGYNSQQLLGKYHATSNN